MKRGCLPLRVSPTHCFIVPMNHVVSKELKAPFRQGRCLANHTEALGPEHSSSHIIRPLRVDLRVRVELRFE